MRKIILATIVSCTTFGTINSQSSFPYSNPFKSLNGLDLQKTQGTPALDNVHQGINLTNGESETSGFTFTDLSFSTKKGFVVDFVYIIYPSSLNTGSANKKFGSGFSFVLFNKNTSTIPTSGSNTNGGLGYAYSYRNPQLPYNGFERGYLGISFDMLGASKVRFTSDQNPTGSPWGAPWRNGIPDLSTTAQNSGSDITIRGPFNPDFYFTPSGSNTRYYGYPVLMSQTTNAAVTPNYWEINGTTGDYTSLTKSMPDFKIYSDEYTNDPNNVNYRRAVISLFPGKKETAEGFYINVTIYHGSIATKVVTDFFIDSSSTINYNDMEKATSTTQTTATNLLKTLSLTPPDNLGIAFFGNTAYGYSSVQNISSLNIALPFSPDLPDASADDVCKTKGRSSSFSVLDGALGYSSINYTPEQPPIGRFSNIDLTSFQFRVYDSATGNFTDTPSQYICTTDAGTYTYDSKTGNITFIPNTAAASLTQDFIYYNIKNKVPTDPASAALATDEYRSRTAKATINLTDTQCPPMPNVYVKINK